MTYKNRMWVPLFLLCALGYWRAVVTSGQNQSDVPQADQQEAPLRLQISSTRQTYAHGERIPIRVEVSNLSSRDVLIARTMWGPRSFSRVSLYAIPKDGHTLSYVQSYADGFPVEGFAQALLGWCIVLPVGYSYSATGFIQGFVRDADLIPGEYRIRAQYMSSGVDANVYYNPLLSRPEELAKLKPASWTGEIMSNQITITIR
jgi:hypothetical protein